MTEDVPPVKIGIIAGSGFYELAGLDEARTLQVDTPFGAPSDAVVVGRLGRHGEVAFLARHGAGHRLLPSEINHRANIYALKMLGVERILSAAQGQRVEGACEVSCA